jgi:hypothetical protein
MNEQCNEWIETSKQLPECFSHGSKRVLVVCENKEKRYINIGLYIKAKTVNADDFCQDEYYDELSDYDEETDCNWVKEGWWIEEIEACARGYTYFNYYDEQIKITHWQPLPKLPEVK